MNIRNLEKLITQLHS